MSGNSHVDVMLAGAIAAFTVDMMIYPLDTLKTRQQSQDFVNTFTNPSAKTRLPSPQLFKGLYQGIGIVVIATLPAAGTFFTVYEASKSFLGRHAADTRLPQPLVHSVASAVAEGASCLVLTPAEVVKQNAQMLRTQASAAGRSGKGGGGGPSTEPGKTPTSTSLRALRQLGGGGGRRLLSGYTALVARNLPFTAIQFPIFESVRARMWGRRRRQQQQQQQQQHRSAARGNSGGGDVDEGRARGRDLLETGAVTGVSAGLAGSFAALVTTPMDVVKTRMMLAAGGEGHRQRGEREVGMGRSEERSGNSRSGSSKYKTRGSLAVAREVVSERGVAGLFRGAVLRSTWTAVGSGLYLGMYEVAKAWLVQSRGEGDDDDDGNSFS